jgi:hypothetical protein
VVTKAEEDAVSFQQSAYIIPPPSPFLLQPHVVPDATSFFSGPNLNDSDSDENETFNATKAITQDSDMPCQPRKIHLSLGNRQKDSSLTLTGMHLSFSIPNYHLSNANTNPCSPDHIRIEVQYGIGIAGDTDNDNGVVHTKIIDKNALNHNDGTRSGNTCERWLPYVVHVS